MADTNIVCNRALSQRFESGRTSSELLAMAFAALLDDLSKSALDSKAVPKMKRNHKSQKLQEVET